jgi:acyl-CoA synthetase (AMP-forming)/AMP-acid ligase II
MAPDQPISPADERLLAVADSLGVIGGTLLQRLDDVAVVDRTGSLTGRAVLEFVLATAQKLPRPLTYGASQQRLLPALLGNSVDSLLLVLAGAVAGMPIAPINARSTANEVLGLASALGASYFVVDRARYAEFAGVDTGITPIEMAPVYSDDATSANTELPPVGQDDPFMVLLTSGTTGVPKPVPVGRSALDTRVGVYRQALGLSHTARYWTGAPFNHVAGIGMQLMALGAGATVVIEGDFSSVDPLQLADLKVTHSMLVPTVIQRWIKTGAFASFQPSVLQYGASPMDPHTLRTALKVLPTAEFVQFFGQTEGSPISWVSPALHRSRTDLVTRSGFVGEPIADIELAFREQGTGALELGVRGDHLFSTDHDGWLWTGDLARIHGEGWIELTGRLADRIIRGGENVYPLEVEALIKECPAVADVAVVGIPEAELGESVLAAVVLEPGLPPPTIEELQTFVRARLAGYKVPLHWRFVEGLPRNAAGKVVRRAIVDMYNVPIEGA